ncbi:MAG: nicotinate (nicotinamide) nucleotide adenylyltransferase, nicotinate-nucleotide adenylyltransferase [Candidatus Gottesmanbacteria bacterium GW2011_GWA2_43_14]|uniref:Probable nicotinate-nucleotide adenylyltransferase n=1 Tax=Candidatus Gottesmanbacteria bacterium GW2011_GWA2_43_14 TaxID=1618443 RepID=A0A0G1DJR7_9BACT|nr:MAG: nicotinate (nicotinamide) nucleotide adenylyltransferase, nicotinate-nucleotide adenylyltransferase [Candidatus Gottesmanbacteria bacterium GW2011_GWA2_43_14]
MNIAILGGRFDPPHIWHFWIAEQVLENVKGIDQVWYMPDFQNAFKPIVAVPHQRAEMLHYLETGRIKLSTIALSKETVTYTVSVVGDLIKDRANRYFWIVGSDITNEFSRWRDYHKLSRMITFLVIPRKDYPIKNLPSGFQRVEGNLMLSNVSSTIIRDRIKQGKTVSGLVFPEVENYIRKNNLYR